MFVVYQREGSSARIDNRPSLISLSFSLSRFPPSFVKQPTHRFLNGPLYDNIVRISLSPSLSLTISVLSSAAQRSSPGLQFYHSFCLFLFLLFFSFLFSCVSVILCLSPSAFFLPSFPSLELYSWARMQLYPFFCLQSVLPSFLSCSHCYTYHLLFIYHIISCYCHSIDAISHPF